MEKVKSVGLRDADGRRGYRNRLEIVRDMLSVVSDTSPSGSRKTHIMYGACLSHKLLSHYLEKALRTGLVICERGTFYKITEKGMAYLELYADYEGNCREIERRITLGRNGEETLGEMLL